MKKISNEELEKVIGGTEEDYDTNFAAGDKFTTSVHPGETCIVVWVMPNNGLCYTVGDSTATHTNPLSVLKPTKVIE